MLYNPFDGIDDTFDDRDDLTPHETPDYDDDDAPPDDYDDDADEGCYDYGDDDGRYDDGDGLYDHS